MQISTKKYNIIYADPPWQYKTWSIKGQGRNAENHYCTMPITDIKALPVADIACSNCILFLWATYPCLPEAFTTIQAWGFTYKTVAFTWVKRNKRSSSYFYGLGHWTRANAEICLLATRGKPQRVSKSVFQIVDTPIERHSQKPAIVRDKIIKLVGDLPRIELFARQRVEGWDGWGNELDAEYVRPEHITNEQKQLQLGLLI